MIRRWRLLGLALVSAVSISSVAFAQGMMEPPTGKNPHRGMERGMMDRPSMRPGGGSPFFSLEGLKEALNLNEDQAKKLHDLFIDYRKGVISKRAALEVSQLELEEMLSEPKLDLVKIEKKAKEKEGAETDLLMFRIRSLAKAKEFLSDAQFNKFRMMIEHQMMAGKMMRGRGHGMMGMMGPGMGPGMGMMTPREKEEGSEESYPEEP